MLKFTPILLLSLFVLISCNNDDTNNDAFEPIEINFTEIQKGTLTGSGLEDISQSNLVIINQTE